MYGYGHQHILRLQEPSELVDENVLPLSVVSPSRIERDIVRETSNIERRLSSGNDELGQIASEMLCRGGRSAVTQSVDPSSVAITLQKNLLRAFNGRLVKLLEKPPRFVQEVHNLLRCVCHDFQIKIEPSERRSPSSSSMRDQSARSLAVPPLSVGLFYNLQTENWA